MVFNRQALYICGIFFVICLLQLGRIAAGDVTDDSTIMAIMSKVGPILGIIGLVGSLVTFPLLFIAAGIEKIASIGFNTSFEILYLLLGVLIVSSKIYKGLFNEQGNIALTSYFITFSLLQFFFDYMEKIRENKIAAGLSRLDALDALGSMIFLSFALVSSLAIGSVAVYLLKKK